MDTIILKDRNMTFDDFARQLATVLVPQIVKAMKDPPKERVSQNEAFRMCGKGNVLRWVRNNMLEPISVRPRRKEYLVQDLQKLYNQQQDYFAL